MRHERRGCAKSLERRTIRMSEIQCQIQATWLSTSQAVRT
jgi:hypothetical protein